MRRQRHSTGNRALFNVNGGGWLTVLGWVSVRSIRKRTNDRAKSVTRKSIGMMNIEQGMENEEGRGVKVAAGEVHRDVPSPAATGYTMDPGRAELTIL